MIKKVEKPSNIEKITREMAASLLPVRRQDAHKGDFGRALVIAGSRQYTGAARLALQAALRSGAGLVYGAVPEPLYPALAGSLAEAIWQLLPAEDGAIAQTAASQIPELVRGKTAVLIGPGLSQSAGALAFLLALLAYIKAENPDLPLVIDADALNLLSRLDDWHEKLPANCLLTPHEMEFARLAGMEAQRVHAQRRELAAAFARRWRQTLILKGAGTLVARADGSLSRLPFANSVLSHGGTGDVLAGLAVGLSAQGLPLYDAARLAVWLHARSAMLALAETAHPAATLPSDLIGKIGRAMAELSGKE